MRRTGILASMILMFVLSNKKLNAYSTWSNNPEASKYLLSVVGLGIGSFAMATGINLIGNAITRKETKESFLFTWIGTFTGAFFGLIASAYIYRQYSTDAFTGYASVTLGGCALGGVTGYILSGFANRPGRVSVAMSRQRIFDSERVQLHVDYAF